VFRFPMPPFHLMILDLLFAQLVWGYLSLSFRQDCNVIDV
jgi:hypothetical protein